MITVINYGMGNLRSVEKVFQHLKFPINISSDIETIMQADKLILPGVGHFSNGVSKLKNSGIWDALNNRIINDKIPILGICLGMQLMTKYSEEGNCSGLGWIDADVKIINVVSSLKVPHMGWNTIKIKQDSFLSNQLNEESSFYFAHSYYVSCNEQIDVLFESSYGHTFVSGFQKENICGVQFHPEKSHTAGIQFIKNFVNS